MRGYQWWAMFEAESFRFKHVKIAKMFAPEVLRHRGNLICYNTFLSLSLARIIYTQRAQTKVL